MQPQSSKITNRNISTQTLKTPFGHSRAYLSFNQVNLRLYSSGQEPTGTKKEEDPRKKLRWSREEVAQHNTESDCWLIVHGKVYNVTTWLATHPGGLQLMRGAGRDASHVFEDEGHSFWAHEKLAEFCIGELTTEQPPRRADLKYPAPNMPDEPQLMHASWQQFGDTTRLF